MAYKNSGECQCGDCTNGQCVGCVRGGDLCLPNDPAMRTPSMLSQIGQRQAFRNATGINSIPAPSGGNNAAWKARMNKLSCNALKSRYGVLSNKLQNLQNAGTNPNWQSQLQGKVSYIKGLIKNNCASSKNFAGTQWQDNAPVGTGWQQNGVFSNWAGDESPLLPITPTLPILPASKPVTAGVSATNMVLSMLSVGVLFFVIGYSFEKGKKA